MNEENNEENISDIKDIIERRTKPPLIRQMSIQPDALSFLDNLDHNQITTKLFQNEENEETSLTCVYCKKDFLIRYSLERHLLKCMEEKIKRLDEENQTLQKKIVELDEEYDNDIQRILKYVDYTDKKWLKICNDNYLEMRRIVEMEMEMDI